MLRKSVWALAALLLLPSDTAVPSDNSAGMRAESILTPAWDGTPATTVATAFARARQLMQLAELPAPVVPVVVVNSGTINCWPARIVDGYSFAADTVSVAGNNKLPYFRCSFGPVFIPNASYWTVQGHSLFFELLVAYGWGVERSHTSGPTYSRARVDCYVGAMLRQAVMANPGLMDEATNWMQKHGHGQMHGVKPIADGFIAGRQCISYK